MIAKLITRPDVVKSGVTDEVFASLTTEYEESLNKTGTLQKITAILHQFVEVCKTGHRVDLIERVSMIYDKVLKPEVTNAVMKKSQVLK